MNAMTIVSPLAASPFPWVVGAGLFFGAAVASAAARVSGRKDPERARTRKWVAACVLFSIAILLGLGALFIPGPSKIQDMRLAWAAGVAAVFAFAALRFKKALGIPIVVLLAVAAITTGLFLRSVRAFTGETEIGVVRVIGVEGASMRLELIPRERDPVLLTMDGVYFSPIVKVVIFNDLFVFLGAKTWYRFEGLTSFDRNLRQGSSDYRFAQPSGISDKLWSLFEANDTRIPGVKTAQIELVMKKAKEFASYSIRIQNDGGVLIEQKSG
jgi:hypothetical protein